MHAQGRLFYRRAHPPPYSPGPPCKQPTAERRRSDTRIAAVLHQGLPAARLHAPHTRLQGAHTPNIAVCASRSSALLLSQCRPWSRQQTHAALAPAHQMLHSGNRAVAVVSGGHTHTCVVRRTCAGSEKQSAQSTAALTLAKLVLSNLLLDRVICRTTNKRSRSVECVA